MTFSPTLLVRADDSQGPRHISFGREPYIEHDGCMVDPALSDDDSKDAAVRATGLFLSRPGLRARQA